MANKRSIEANCINDWQESHEALLGWHQSWYPYGKEYPTTADWPELTIALTRMALTNLSLVQPLWPWIAQLSRIWQCYLNPADKELEVIQDTKTYIYAQANNEGQTSHKYYKHSKIPHRETHGEPASIVEKEDGVLKVKMMGGLLHTEEDPEHQTFTEFLCSWGGAYMQKGSVIL